jgi:hypothetical protein
VLATGERLDQLGEHPNGYLSYSSDGRMYAIVSAENRVKPREFAPTDEERLILHRALTAYAGTYTQERGRWSVMFRGASLSQERTKCGSMVWRATT